MCGRAGACTAGAHLPETHARPLCACWLDASAHSDSDMPVMAGALPCFATTQLSVELLQPHALYASVCTSKWWQLQCSRTPSVSAWGPE